MRTKIKIPDTGFIKFPKIARLYRDCTITEKIDGTNSLIYITEGNEIHTASRNRWITPDQDNYGFSFWVQENQNRIIDELGPGFHRGEWCGCKIQRGYGLIKRFFVVFDTEKYERLGSKTLIKKVSMLWKGKFSTSVVDTILKNLKEHGSVFAPGYDRPEGVVIRHLASNTMYKVTLENDEQPKSRGRT